MKVLLLMPAILLFASCNERVRNNSPSEKTLSQNVETKRYDLNGWGALQVIKVDSCEYLIITGTDKGGIIHKADCSNPIHKAMSNTANYETNR